MLLSAHQCAYNPWLGYLHKIISSERFVVMDDVQFEKNSFINRNKIVLNGTEVMLTIPVATKDYTQKSLREMRTADNFWQKKHLRSIEQAYKKAPLFERLFTHLMPIYEQKSDFLIDYTDAYLRFLVSYLEIRTPILYASSLDIKAKKLDYVIEMCQKTGASSFLFGALGREYADEKVLKDAGITPIFQNYNHPLYSQTSAEFHPYMGIIDLLFNEHDPQEVIMRGNTITKEFTCQKES
ncbi:MAG: WbqC family protein [Epsilonproteobacteria bacterium]|nr:WbqC family protein [Campylobacterota bacterium]